MTKKTDCSAAVKNLMIGLLCTAFIVGCSPKTSQVKREVMLKPANWYAYSKERKSDNASDLFSVTDTLIRLYGEKAGYLMSKKSYASFELSLDYRWNTEPKYSHGSGKKNSGVMYNIPDTAADGLWPAGIQFQVKEGNTGDFILLGNTTLKVRGVTGAPGASVNVARTADHDNATGDWNKIVIRSYKGHCEQYLNGVLVNEGSEASSANGRILLQYEGSPIDFKNIVIKPI